MKKIKETQANEEEHKEVQDVKQKKIKLIGSLYCDYVNNVNDE